MKARPSPRTTYDEPLTFEELDKFWQQCDERLAAEELQRLWHPRTPRVVVIGWCLYGVVVLSVVTTLPALLRAVGGS